MKDEQRELLRALIETNLGADTCSWEIADIHQSGVIGHLKNNGYITITNHTGNRITCNITPEGLLYLNGKGA